MSNRVKTSIAILPSLWREFRAACTLKGSNATEVLEGLMADFVEKECSIVINESSLLSDSDEVRK